MTQRRRPFIARITKILHNESGKILIDIYLYDIKVKFYKGVLVITIFLCYFLVNQISINLANSFNIHI